MCISQNHILKILVKRVEYALVHMLGNPFYFHVVEIDFGDILFSGFVREYKLNSLFVEIRIKTPSLNNV